MCNLSLYFDAVPSFFYVEFSYLMTNTFLENVFSVIRGFKGNNSHPDSTEFCRRMRALLLVHRPSDILPLRPVVNDEAAEDNIDDEEEDSESQSFMQIQDIQDWTHVDRGKKNYSQAVCYLAGYIAKKVKALTS